MTKQWAILSVYFKPCCFFSRISYNYSCFYSYQFVNLSPLFCSPSFLFWQKRGPQLIFVPFLMFFLNIFVVWYIFRFRGFKKYFKYFRCSLCHKGGNSSEFPISVQIFGHTSLRSCVHGFVFNNNYLPRGEFFNMNCFFNLIVKFLFKTVCCWKFLLLIFICKISIFSWFFPDLILGKFPVLYPFFILGFIRSQV